MHLLEHEIAAIRVGCVGAVSNT